MAWRDWLHDWRAWVGAGGALALLGLVAFRRPLTRALASAVSPVAIDTSGLASGYDRTYRITATDKLWLGRALAGEVGESGWDSEVRRIAGAAVLWALIQGYLTRGHRNYSTLTSFTRGYCQPVNPRWMTPGVDRCADYPSACTPDRIARRQRLSSLAWTSLPQPLRWLVDAWARGEVPNPVPGLTDWHANQWTGATVQIGGNWFGAR
jgi:hypothetical protein